MRPVRKPHGLQINILCLLLALNMPCLTSVLEVFLPVCESVLREVILRALDLAGLLSATGVGHLYA